MKTLLEQAKEIEIERRTRRYNQEELDLYLAWLHGEVGTIQVGKTLFPERKSKVGASVLYAVATCLRIAIEQEILKLHELKNKWWYILPYSWGCKIGAVAAVSDKRYVKSGNYQPPLKL